MLCSAAMYDLPFSPQRAALFLDFDGTLVEIAARPEEVIVPPALPALLERLSRSLGGALAVVSGRPIVQLDTHLPAPIVKVGDHGGAVRLSPEGEVTMPPLPEPPAEWRAAAEALAAGFAGAIAEQKAHGLVLHYRLAPEAEVPARDLLEGFVASSADFTLMRARMAWELKPRGVSKGTAVAALLSRAPFAGRVPVFVGDDVTDEAGMAAARAAGGVGLRLQDAFGTPANFRGWLGELDRRLAEPAGPAAGAA